MKFIGLLISILLFAATDALACHPLVQCSGVNSDGTVTAVFSFVGGENTIVIGSRNQFSPDPKSRGQGTHFNTKKNGAWVFGSDSSVAGQASMSVSVPAGQTVSWSLNGRMASCTAPKRTPTPTPTNTATPTPTPTPTKTPTNTPTPCPPTATPTPQPTSTPTPKPTEPPSTPTPLPTSTSTPQPTPTEPLPTPTPNPTKPPATPTPEPTPTVPNECPLEPTGINKKKLLGFARTLQRKAVKYYGISGKCGNSKFKKQILQVSQLLKLFKIKLESFPVEVEICGDDCVEVVTKERLNELRKIARGISKHAVRSQHYGSLCHQKGKGIAGTKPIIDKFKDEVNSCLTHVCPK